MAPVKPAPAVRTVNACALRIARANNAATTDAAGAAENVATISTVSGDSVSASQTATTKSVATTAVVETVASALIATAPPCPAWMGCVKDVAPTATTNSAVQTAVKEVAAHAMKGSIALQTSVYALPNARVKAVATMDAASCVAAVAITNSAWTGPASTYVCPTATTRRAAAMDVANPAVPANRVPFVQKTSVSARRIAQPNNAATMDAAAIAGIVRLVLLAMVSPVSAHQTARTRAVATTAVE